MAGNGSDDHNTHVVGLDGDGKNEVGGIVFMLNGDGTLRCDMTTSGIGHGDRWQIIRMDPSRQVARSWRSTKESRLGL